MDSREWEEMLPEWHRLVIPVLVARLKDSQGRLRSRKETADLEEVRFLQGRVEELEHLIRLPEREIEELTRKKK